MALRADNTPTSVGIYQGSAAVFSIGFMSVLCDSIQIVFAVTAIRQAMP